MPIPDDLDQQIRTAAFIQVRRMLELRDPLTSEDLARGFVFQGERIPLINPQRGIFKPTAMKYALSIKTVVPRKGARIWYDDQKAAHDQIYKGDETVAYSFMGTNSGGGRQPVAARSHGEPGPADLLPGRVPGALPRDHSRHHRGMGRTIAPGAGLDGIARGAPRRPAGDDARAPLCAERSRRGCTRRSFAPR